MAARCDGFAGVSPSITSHNTVFKPPQTYASFSAKTDRGDRLRIIPSPSSPFNSKPKSRHTRLFSAASLPIDDDTGDDRSSNRNSVRPKWALPWMPTWLINLRPITQFIVGLGLYIFHLRVLTQHGITFPFQLIPNDEGWFQSIGLDSLAGIFSLIGMVWLRKSSMKHSANDSNIEVVVPSVWSDPTHDDAPWKLRRQSKKDKRSDDENKSMEEIYHPRSTSIVAFVLLTIGYFSTGRFSLFFENALYAAAGYGVPMTVPMHRR